MSEVTGASRRQEPGRRSIVILYGSETGNSEEIARELGQMAERLHFRAEVDELDGFKLRDILNFSLAIFVTSTTGQGEMPANASQFWRNMLRQSLNGTNCLKRLHFAVFGLGDSSYPKFNWAARKLRRRLLQLGGNEFFRTGEADEMHDDGIDSIYLPWFQELRDFLIANYLPSPLQPIPDDTQLPPKFNLRLIPGPPREGEFSSEDLVPNQNTFRARLTSNERATPKDHWQDTRLLTFDIESPTNDILPDLVTGSTLVIYPENSAEDVQAMIGLMGWSSIADEPLEWVSSAQSSSHTTTPTGLSRARLPHLSPNHHDGQHQQRQPSLRALLTRHFDIAAVPKRSFFAQLAFFAAEPRERERLVELSSPANRQEYNDYATRPRRTLVESIRDFPSVRVPLAWCIELLPVIRGREFSVAGGGFRAPYFPPSFSSPASASDSAGAAPTDKLSLRGVQILAALVEYQTIIRKPRQGLCSRYLKHLGEGTLLRVGIDLPARDKSIYPLPPPPPPLPTTQAILSTKRTIQSHTRPLIAIATGTGIAPIRCMLHERAALRRVGHGPSGPELLFYGCRSARADFYFRGEWAAMSAGGSSLTVHAAFSRDSDPVPEVNDTSATAEGVVAAPSYDAGKNYVQHHIRRHYGRVCELMREFPLVMVCGNAGRMPTSVRAALRDALVKGAVVGSDEEAERYLEDGTKVTYWQETW